MTPSLCYNTVTPLLREILDKLMRAPELSLFRLVGGTSLSLRLGHRESVDIDLFTEQDYGTIDWRAIYGPTHRRGLRQTDCIRSGSHFTWENPSSSV